MTSLKKPFRLVFCAIKALSSEINAFDEYMAIKNKYSDVNKDIAVFINIRTKL